MKTMWIKNKVGRLVEVEHSRGVRLIAKEGAELAENPKKQKEEPKEIKLEMLKKDDLISTAKNLGIEVNEEMTKKILIDLINNTK